jgi:hypothetical protein
MTATTSNRPRSDVRRSRENLHHRLQQQTVWNLKYNNNKSLFKSLSYTSLFTMEKIIQREGRCVYPEQTSMRFTITGESNRGPSLHIVLFCAIGCATSIR